MTNLILILLNTYELRKSSANGKIRNENTYNKKVHNRLLKICTTNFLKNVY